MQPPQAHPSEEEREIIKVSTALTYARSSNTWKEYVKKLNWELKWYFHRPFYER